MSDPSSPPPWTSLTPREGGVLDQACGHDTSLRQHLEGLLAEQEQLGKLPGSAARLPLSLWNMASCPRECRHDDRAATSCSSRSAKGAWASSSWPSRRRPSAARSRSRSSSRAWTPSRSIARFEAERQALAMMDHPNIARVLDAGATETGRPYFVMELVHGVPITEYCDDKPAHARASGWSCSSRSARRSSTPTRRGSSTATSSRRTSW